MTKFYSIQILVFVALGLVAWKRHDDVNDRPMMPALRDQPREVGPLYDYPMAVTDQQLTEVLYKLRPRFNEQPTKVNFVDHAIRMWGKDATFGDDSLSGPRMQELLLNHDAFESMWSAPAPLLQRSEGGIAVSTQVGRESVSHVDHLMGTLCEIGVPLSQPVKTANGDGRLGEIIEYGLNHFSLNQREYEWTSLATAFYAIDGQHWFTREGQAIDFDTFASRLMRQQQPEGVCYGQHRLYTLTMLLRIDDQMRDEGVTTLLTSQVRDQICDYLLVMNQRLLCSQAEHGYWDGNWPNASLPVPDPGTNELSRRILATGHVLEWWAMAPEELQPPRESIIRAAQWLSREIIAMDETTIEKNFTFLSHAGRALALWRGCLPADFLQRQEGKLASR
ncbi:hypothetical protein LOC67_19515 [Stieleria sp. JC731]|uniref:hypothetical protein n=1 Tax=Pirellulaceae TaxID=2691357 RepID=UPI001E2B1A27|nr:hypothetical protein [Stieleria sp. JC731]MCC9602744.1 hypothetical protein [Stieleria sp. JC731]